MPRARMTEIMQPAIGHQKRRQRQCHDRHAEPARAPAGFQPASQSAAIRPNATDSSVVNPLTNTLFWNKAQFIQ